MSVASALSLLRCALLSDNISDVHSVVRSAIGELERGENAVKPAVPAVPPVSVSAVPSPVPAVSVSAVPVPAVPDASVDDVLSASLGALSLDKPAAALVRPRIKVLSLFDGISCARVALDKAGFSDVDYYASELDNHAIKIAQKNWPETHQLGDVREVKEMDGLFLLIGGSPCQDLSIAKAVRAGLDGERSSLFFEYVRIKDECSPLWFILENVASMPKDARDIISAKMGVEPVMIDAGLVSAQHRKRLFWTNIPIVDLPEDRHIVLKDILEDKPDKKYSLSHKPFTPMPNKRETDSGLIRLGHVGTPTKEKSGEKPDDWSAPSRVYSPEGKSPTLMTGVSPKIDDGETTRKLTPKECERLQGLPDDYTACVADTHRFHAIGNAFHVDVVAWILTFIPFQ